MIEFFKPSSELATDIDKLCHGKFLSSQDLQSRGSPSVQSAIQERLNGYVWTLIHAHRLVFEDLEMQITHGENLNRELRTCLWPLSCLRNNEAKLLMKRLAAEFKQWVVNNMDEVGKMFESKVEIRGEDIYFTWDKEAIERECKPDLPPLED